MRNCKLRCECSRKVKFSMQRNMRIASRVGFLVQVFRQSTREMGVGVKTYWSRVLCVKFLISDGQIKHKNRAFIWQHLYYTRMF